MRKTILLWVTGMLIIALAFAFERYWSKPAAKAPRRMQILSSESPASGVDKDPAATETGEVRKVPVPALQSGALSERQAALKLILEDFRTEQERVAKLGQSVDHELTKATAKLFIQISRDSSSENVVKLLVEMTDQQAAKVLAEIALTDAELSESLSLQLGSRKP